jgi:hypothetical protein
VRSNHNNPMTQLVTQEICPAPASRGGGTKDLAHERPGDRALPSQRLAIELRDDTARRGEAALDPYHDKAYQAVIDRELMIGEQLDQDGTQHGVVGSRKRDHRQRAQPRGEIGKSDRPGCRRCAGWIIASSTKKSVGSRNGRTDWLCLTWSEAMNYVSGSPAIRRPSASLAKSVGRRIG